MATKLATFNFGRTGHSKYPWSEWLDGSIWKLTQGEDFSCKPAAIVGNARHQARKTGHRLNHHIDGDTVIIQRGDPKTDNPKSSNPVGGPNPYRTT